MTSRQHSWQPVCTVSDLTPGKFVEFRLREKAREPEDMPLTGFLFLDGTAPRAYLNVCPHLGVELNWMPGRFMDSDNLFIQCMVPCSSPQMESASPAPARVMHLPNSTLGNGKARSKSDFQNNRHRFSERQDARGVAIAPAKIGPIGDYFHARLTGLAQ